LLYLFTVNENGALKELKSNYLCSDSARNIESIIDLYW